MLDFVLSVWRPCQLVFVELISLSNWTGAWTKLIFVGFFCFPIRNGRLSTNITLRSVCWPQRRQFRLIKSTKRNSSGGGIRIETFSSGHVRCWFGRGRDPTGGVRTTFFRMNFVLHRLYLIGLCNADWKGYSAKTIIEWVFSRNQRGTHCMANQHKQNRIPRVTSGPIELLCRGIPKTAKNSYHSIDLYLYFRN